MNPEGRHDYGYFVTLEGPEGSGKSTLAGRLAARLQAAGYVCTVTREPGGTQLGEAIREVLLHSAGRVPVPAADALLFNAARAQHVAEVIGPALDRGEVVICDRFGDSSLAYQGYGSGLALAPLRDLVRFATGGLTPDLTVLLDLPVEVGLGRKTGGEVTRFEERHEVEFHRRVREGFLALAAAEPGRFLVLDGQAPADEIEASLAPVVIARLGDAGDSLFQVRNSPKTRPAGSEPERPPLRID